MASNNGSNGHVNGRYKTCGNPLCPVMVPTNTNNECGRRDPYCPACRRQYGVGYRAGIRRGKRSAEVAAMIGG